MEFWKLNLRIWILEIKFKRNWNFENYLGIGVLEIKWRLKFWKLNLRIVIFGKSLENGIWDLKILKMKNCGVKTSFFENQFFKSRHGDGWEKRHVNFMSGPPSTCYHQHKPTATNFLPPSLESLSPSNATSLSST